MASTLPLAFMVIGVSVRYPDKYVVQVLCKEKSVKYIVSAVIQVFHNSCLIRQIQ